MRRLKDIETAEYSLEVYECDCGFHIGLDVSYLDSVAELQVPCPVCEMNIVTIEPMEHKERILAQYEVLASKKAVCPTCGSDNILSDITEWEAKSIDDPDNTAVLAEHQCKDCDGKSFWL